MVVLFVVRFVARRAPQRKRSPPRQAERWMAAHTRITPHVRRTPVVQVEAAAFGTPGPIVLKLECLQHTGSFKPRGALSVMLDLDAADLARGVTGVSAGTSISVRWRSGPTSISRRRVAPWRRSEARHLPVNHVRTSRTPSRHCDCPPGSTHAAGRHR
jgi:hypothetical protein